MLWEYIVNNYSPGEPIFKSDICLDMSESNIRKQLMILVNTGKIKRYENGIYYIPKISKLGIEMSIIPDDIIELKYISNNKEVFGYYGGFVFANQIGITTQMPAVKEVYTSKIGHPIKRIEKNKRSFVVRKSRTQITEENYRVLQLLDLLEDIETYSEISGEELKACLAAYINEFAITKKKIDKYLQFYPNKIYKSIYETEILNVLA